MIYVDNGFHLGCGAQAVQRDTHAVVKYLNSVGLDAHEEADVCTECVGLGVVVDGNQAACRMGESSAQGRFSDHSWDADFRTPA